nr:MAG TPA: hypothetical protein [Crassvirales sp.]DAR56522.1 MAG TPA: hypothetical protein [Crassvirales sp.]
MTSYYFISTYVVSFSKRKEIGLFYKFYTYLICTVFTIS